MAEEPFASWISCRIDAKALAVRESPPCGDVPTMSDIAAILSCRWNSISTFQVTKSQIFGVECAA